MPTDIFKLPAEIRNWIYELALVHECPIDPRFINNKNTQIFRTSKAIRCETVPIFYGQNCFDLASMSGTGVAQFFNMIGSSSASHIRHIRIPFPAFQSGHFSVTPVRALCTSLRNITMTLRSTRQGYISPDGYVVRTAIQSADGFLKTFRRYSELTIEVEVHSPCDDDSKAVMRAAGWEVKVLRQLPAVPVISLYF